MTEGKDILQENVCLALLPFWSPVIPPPGILSIRNYLKGYGYSVDIVDFNTKASFRKIPIEYFRKLKLMIPNEKLRDLSAVGFHVLRNHLMINQNCSDRSKRFEYLREVLAKNFYSIIDESGFEDLDGILDHFYENLGVDIDTLMKTSKPDILGISVYEDTLPASIFSFKLAKAINPEVLTIMGGGVFHDILKLGSSNFEYFVKSTLGFIDKIVVGEGEIFFKKLLSGTLDKNKRVYSKVDIQEEDLNFTEVDYTDFADLQLDQYPYVSSFMSRSCPFKCKFCTENSYSGPYRVREVPDVANELNHILENSRKNFIFFTDLLLNPIINELSEALGKLSRPCSWEGYMRVDSICTKENAASWRNAGLTKAMIGVETGSEAVLKLMDKGISTELIAESLVNLANAGIKTTVFIIVGFPGESEKDFNDTLLLISKLEKYIYEVYCTPFYYYPDIQKKSSDWDERLTSLYQKIPRDILVMMTYTLLDCNPSREITYDRLHRVITHCEQFGIKPNRFAYDIYNADKRWKKLHSNAAPSMFDIQ